MLRLDYQGRGDLCTNAVGEWKHRDDAGLAAVRRRRAGRGRGRIGDGQPAGGGRPNWALRIRADKREILPGPLGVTLSQYTGPRMTYDLCRPRLKGLIFRPPRSNRYFVTPYGWKVARLFSRLEARVFRPAIAMFTGNDAVLPFPLRASLDRVDAQLDELIGSPQELVKTGKSIDVQHLAISGPAVLG